MGVPSGEIVERPLVARACGCLREFQHYAVDKYRAQRLAKFQASRCPACVQKLQEEQKRAAEARRPADETRKQANENRTQAAEMRKQELHKYGVWLAEARAEHQELLNMNLETPENRVPNRIERIIARQKAA